MKLGCPSCQAKYSVPAEKVVGKVVKARCRKCGDALVVLGGAADPIREERTHEPSMEAASKDDRPARRSPRARPDGDLFAGANSAGAETEPRVREARLAGQRNDTSVLFSLGALSREAAELEAPSRASSGAAEGDGSGLIDIRALSAVHGRKSVERMPTIDDLVSLGGGGLGQGPGLFSPPAEAPAEGTLEAREGKRGLVVASLGAGLFFMTAVVLTLVLTREKAPVAAPALAVPRTAKVEVDIAPVRAADAPAVVASSASRTAGETPLALPTAVPPKPNGNAKAKLESPPTPHATVPATPPVPSPLTLDSAMRPPFNRGEAAAALASVAYGSCKKPDGPAGTGHVYVTFEPSGSVSTTVVDQGAFAGTPVGGCIAGKFRGARVPAFAGSPVRVGKTVSL